MLLSKYVCYANLYLKFHLPPSSSPHKNHVFTSCPSLLEGTYLENNCLNHKSPFTGASQINSASKNYQSSVDATPQSSQADFQRHMEGTLSHNLLPVHYSKNIHWRFSRRWYWLKLQSACLVAWLTHNWQASVYYSEVQKFLSIVPAELF